MMPVDAVSADLAASLRGGADALYALLADRLRHEPGFDLLTVLAPNAIGDRLVRLFTSNAAQYPLGDADTVEDNRWFQRLFLERQPVVANDPWQIRAWLPDFSELDALGYGSLANIPVVVSDETVGVINLMGSPGHFSPGTVEIVAAQAPLAALAILARPWSLRTPVLPQAGSVVDRISALREQWAGT